MTANLILSLTGAAVIIADGLTSVVAVIAAIEESACLLLILFIPVMVFTPLEFEAQ
jgi:hypothetical protein